ncbi:hypothetical protein OG205_38560 [Lentzea sp. NBC_00516]|uniref:hypothetical protein n=1 Tax=Lentzea sp. NBC_00516 TaxID=2903582 RepID=UPI002E81C645|nr:hypothetical protein [Lentzea sp. NBC_00516]WUD23897.1 hypothetical protein OG205_38560 [Lentzea sp. NBC_00516]
MAELGCCEIAPGLTDAEFARIEAEHEFEFADDHRAFLAAGLPVNTPHMSEAGVFHTWDQAWPEWRGEPDDLHRQLGGPVKRAGSRPGIRFCPCTERTSSATALI